MTIYADTLKRAIKWRGNISGSEWADEYRYVAPGTSPEPGRWRTSRVPYLREPMDSATDRTTEITVLMFSSQVGKSEALLNIMGYYVDQEPAPQLMVQPTVEMAEAFSKERIDPTFRYSEGLRSKLEEGQDGRGSSRKSSTTIRMKKFTGGYLALVGANSPAGLASRPVRVLLCDEVDRYGTTKEGDPLKLAMQRTTNFHNRKIVLVSTPTISGGSHIERWWNRSDKRQFYVPCPHCGVYHVLRWEDVKWEKDEFGNALPDTAMMVCPECGGKTRGSGKPDPHMIEAGYWKDDGSSTKIRGYHLNSLYSPWVSLSSLVEEFTTAVHNRDNEGLMEFINLKLGEPWEEQEKNDNWEQLHKRREYYPVNDILPDGILLLTAGVDVQHDRLECTVYGWGVGRECWGIQHQILWGKPDDDATWQQLDQVLQRQFILSSGISLPISCSCIDSGDGAYTANVYQFTKARERMRSFSIKGRGGIGVPFISTPSKNNTYKAILFTLGVDSGKSLVTSRLTVADEGPGFVHYPMQRERGFNENFFKQLTAEVFERKFEKGKIISRWKKIRERNEALDCFVYATAAMEIMNPNFEYLAEYYANGGAVQHVSNIEKPRSRILNKGIEL